MKKKVKLVLFVVFSLMFLVGWGKKGVEMLNHQKLIDLEAALQVCMHGDSLSESHVNTDNDKEPDVSTDVKQETDEEKTIIISVRGRKVIYDSVAGVDLNKLEDRIRQDYSDKVTFQLIDDYAEAHVYKRIRAILSKLEVELGLEYTQGRGE